MSVRLYARDLRDSHNSLGLPIASESFSSNNAFLSILRHLILFVYSFIYIKSGFFEFLKEYVSSIQFFSNSAIKPFFSTYSFIYILGAILSMAVIIF